VRRTIIFTVTIIFAVALLARAMTYTVRFTETAVLTTFGSAGADAVKRDPGLKFKWPDPVQSVTKYDTRSRFLQTRSETQQTADSRQLVVEGFCTWKVSDPLKFFQRFSNAGASAKDHYAKADSVIRDNLRSALGETSKFRLDDLFTTAARGSKLPSLEEQILLTLRAGNREGSFADYGIEIEEVGINRVRLPQETTSQVIESMKSGRGTLVKALESRGASEAQAITSTAESNARRIERFAEAYAAEIRRLGDQEAQQFVAQMGESPELAVFLKNMEFLRTAYANRITLVFNTDQAGFEAMNGNVMRSAAKGVVPGVGSLMGMPRATTESQPTETSPVVPVAEPKVLPTAPAEEKDEKIAGGVR
jgi:modulator of FtsH protease HflC